MSPPADHDPEKRRGPAAPDGDASTVDADVVVIGSGIAGLVFALETAARASVILITKKDEADSNTNYAQGGIAAVLGPDDRPDLHVRDTLEAGAGLCHPDVVEEVVREGPERVRDLMEWGARFHHEEGAIHLGREGGHSRRRIVHAADRTGREIERALLEAVDRAGVRILEDHLAVDLLVRADATTGELRCAGVVALDHARGRRVVFRAPTTLLAAGGCGQVYRHTTNPAIATGDGVAMAHRAGARVANMEFMQFHPTTLYPSEDPAFLISEAVRGEGAVLRRLDGAAFMEKYDERGSLASRDIVARAIHSELKRTGDEHVLLDLSPIPREEAELRFPGTVKGCRERGVDLFGTGIPVVPAAHYACGGALTDGAGRTSLPGLYAAGEVACTGMHGANRLASNSLLEAVVFSHRAADAVIRELEESSGPEELPAGSPSDDPSAFPGSPAPDSAEPAGSEPVEVEPDEAEAARIAHVRAGIRDLMWEKVGIVRSDAELEEARETLIPILRDEDRRWSRGRWSVEAAEARNLARAALLVVESARRRKESRGLHYNADHPERDDATYGSDTIVGPEVF